VFTYSAYVVVGGSSGVVFRGLWPISMHTMNYVAMNKTHRD
jgi:hypothetical protein